MKNFVAAFSLVICATSAIAQTQPSDKALQAETTKQLVQMNNQLMSINAELLRLRQDVAAPRLPVNTPLCWNESKPYSVGARLDSGLVCVPGATPNSVRWEHPSAWK